MSKSIPVTVRALCWNAINPDDPCVVRWLAGTCAVLCVLTLATASLRPDATTVTFCLGALLGLGVASQDKRALVVAAVPLVLTLGLLVLTVGRIAHMATAVLVFGRARIIAMVLPVREHEGFMAALEESVHAKRAAYWPEWRIVVFREWTILLAVSQFLIKKVIDLLLTSIIKRILGL